MYEFQPTARKERVYWKAAIAAVFATACFGVSRIPSVSYPSAWQLGTIVGFGTLILLVVNGLMKSYLYRVAPREDASSEVADFTITEYYGKRISVVCRISLSDILDVLPADRKTRAGCEKMGPVFVYAVPTPPEQRRILRVECDGKLFFVEMVTDKTFLDLLSTFKQQNMS